MFRIAPAVCNARFLLSQRPAQLCPTINKLSQTSIRQNKVLERDPCPQPPPPPPPPPKDRRLLFGALLAALFTGAFVVYAKESPEIRDWLTLYMPWFDDFIAALYQEDMTYGERAESWKQCMEKCYLEHFSKERAERIKKCALEGGAGLPVSAQNKKTNDSGDPCTKKPPPEKDICKLERCVNELGDTVIDNFALARDASMYYNNFVQEALSKCSPDSMSELGAARADREQIDREAMENVADASTKFDDLREYIVCGVEAPKEVLDKTRELFDNFSSRIGAVRAQYQWEREQALAYDEQIAKVQSLVNKFISENQVLLPGTQYDAEKPALKGDGDLYLYHATRYIKKLSAEVAEAVDAMSLKVARNLQTLPQGEKEKMEREKVIQTSYKAKKAELDKEFALKYTNLAKAMDNMTKTAIKEQLDKHEATLALRLRQREDELMSKMDKLVGEQVAVEKAVFTKQLDEMAAKVKDVEDRVNASLKAERESRMSQELWAAASALLAATKKGEPIVDVQKELKAIEKAGGDGDKLVSAVLKALPPSVREQGVTPESVLRQKYHVMEDVALKVALVEHDGAPLPIYFLSWLQSALLFMKLSSIPRAEFEKPPKEPSPELDTFDLLQRARFWIDRGDIGLAWRYVSALEGASRGAAEPWLRAAGGLLRTRQACDALLAHAAAQAVKYL